MPESGTICYLVVCAGKTEPHVILSGRAGLNTRTPFINPT